MRTNIMTISLKAAFLLFLQSAVGVGLAIVANKATDQVRLGPGWVWGIACGLLVVSALLGVLLAREVRGASERSFARVASSGVPVRATAPLMLVPTSFLVGAATANIVIALSSPIYIDILWKPHIYEIWVSFFCVAFLAAQSRIISLRGVPTLCLTAIGYGLGVAAGILLFQSRENEPLRTILGWLIFPLLVALLVRLRLVQRILAVLQDTIQGAFADEEKKPPVLNE